MLLKARTINTGNQCLLELVSVGGKARRVQPPFNPYFYAPERSMRAVRCVQVEKRVLSTFELTKLYRCEFARTDWLEDSRWSGSLEDDIPFVQRVVIDQGLSEESKLPTYASFDLEILTKGQFARVEFDPIGAISFYSKDLQECWVGEEREIILSFLRVLKQVNPCVLAGYASGSFDIPYFVRRCELLRINPALGRDSSPPLISQKRFKAMKRKRKSTYVDLSGRIHFDVYREVDEDQSLLGIKNKQLKTVAKTLLPKEKIIEVDRNYISKLSGEQLREYCLNDARLTYLLAEHYLKNLFALAEMLKLPLNLVVDRAPSHIPTLLYMRELAKLNIVCDHDNQTRYPQFFKEEKRSYQGAYTKLFQKGLFAGIKKIDYKSLYPSICAAFNLSPETVRLLLITPYTNKIDFSERGVIEIDDNKIGQIKCSIDLTHDSITRLKIREFMRMREELKYQAQDELVTSRQWAIKILMNSIYGFHGMRYARAGCAPIAALVTALGRFCVKQIIEKFTREVDWIEVDTDGLYYQGVGITQEAIEYIRSLIPEFYDSSYFKLESEQYDDSIFYEEKNYILRKDKQLIFHGSGFKGRHLPKICDDFATDLAHALLDNCELQPIIVQYGDLKRHPLEKFAMTVELSKERRDYKARTMYANLIQQLDAAKIEHLWGNEVNYVKTRKGFKPLGISETYDLDYEYYKTRLAEIAMRILHHLDRKTIESILGGQMRLWI